MEIDADRSDRAALALNTILHRPMKGMPTDKIHLMEHSYIERLAGALPGEYRRELERIYLAMLHAAGACLLDQYIPENPLQMSEQGYVGPRSATTGINRIVQDGILIDSPEAVVEHMERVVFPKIKGLKMARA
jgi:hypothetical protein